MAHPKAEVLRRPDDAMERGDIEGFLSRYTDDVVVQRAVTQLRPAPYWGPAPVNLPGRRIS